MGVSFERDDRRGNIPVLVHRRWGSYELIEVREFGEETYAIFTGLVSRAMREDPEAPRGSPETISSYLESKVGWFDSLNPATRKFLRECFK